MYTPALTPPNGGAWPLALRLRPCPMPTPDTYTTMHTYYTIRVYTNTQVCASAHADARLHTRIFKINVHGHSCAYAWEDGCVYMGLPCRKIFRYIDTSHLMSICMGRHKGLHICVYMLMPMHILMLICFSPVWPSCGPRVRLAVRKVYSCLLDSCCACKNIWISYVPTLLLPGSRFFA